MRVKRGNNMTEFGMCARLLIAAAVALAAPPTWAAEGYPTKPVRFLVGFAPGGANDLVARVVAAKLGPRLGQQVVVDNRAGAGGNIAHDIVAKAAPDGYTMVLASVASLAMSPGLLGKLPFDPVNDFAPVQGFVLLVLVVYLLVNLGVDLLYSVLNPQVRHG